MTAGGALIAPWAQLLAEDERAMTPGRCWYCGRFTQHGMTACAGHELIEAVGEMRWMTPLVIRE